MSWEDQINIYNDPVTFLTRKGDAKDPYKLIKETVQIINGKANLREVPDRTYKVKVTGNNQTWYEVEDDELKDNFFQVDYVQGNVFFTAATNGKSLTFEYYGKGVYLTPDSRIYLTKTNDPLIHTANEKFADLDRKDNEQKNRVDTLITKNPQPSEVVDLRVDRNGLVFNVARDRINSEQKKIEDAYKDLNGYYYDSLKNRIDAEQKKIEDAYKGGNGQQYPSLADRLNTEYQYFLNRFNFKNAINYGADPTGTTPAADKLQKALDEIHAEGGGELFIPNGKYLINKRLYIYENTVLTMADNCTLLRGWGGGFLANGKPGDTFYGYNGRGNITIRGGCLDGNYSQIDKYPTKEFDAIGLAHGENITIENVTFKDVISDHAIDLNGCKKVRIRNCKFIGFIDLSGQNRYFSEAIQIAECTSFGFNMFGAPDATPNTDIVIENNYFGKSDKLGAYPCAIGNHYTVYDVFQNNIIIKNNTIEDCSFAGVRTFKWGETQIINNMFKRNYNCVRITQASGGIESSKNKDGVQTNKPQNAENVLIEGNNFYYYTSYAIVTFGQIYNNEVAWSDGIRIFNNYFKLSTEALNSYSEEQQAVNVVFARNVFIDNNRIYGGHKGFRIEGCFNTFITNNYISEVGSEAIYMSKSRDTTGSVSKSIHLKIDGNEINTTGKNGIYLQNIDYFSIRNNTIFNPNQTQEVNKNRGGIFVQTGYDGRVEGNRIRGDKKNFAIWIAGGAKDVNVFNNNGSDKIIVDGSDNFSGYYSVNTDKYIIKVKL